MKILVINCGSSSLKYQLIDMDGEKVLCKGLCERIGMESSMITHDANGHKATTPAIFPTHTEAFAEVVKKMTTGEGLSDNAKALLLSLLAGTALDRDAALAALRAEWGFADPDADTTSEAADAAEEA